MQLLILALCALLVTGVAATTVVALWSTRGSAAARRAASRQSLAVELVWTAIPCLMLLAAVIPAVLAVVAKHSQ